VYLLYLSGQIGTDSTGKLVAGGIGPETRQTMENIRAVVETNGSRASRDRVPRGAGELKCYLGLVL